MDGASRAGISLLDVCGFGEPLFDESVEGPIDERTSHGEDSPHFGVGAELFGQRESVTRTLGEQSEDCVFGHREIAHGTSAFQPGTVVTMRLMAALALVGLLVGCRGDTGEETRLVVSAAASLSDVFAAMEEVFEEANADVDLILNLGGSSTLREQILEGAPVDVFASANASTMDEVVGAGLTATEPSTFATNRLVIAVPAGNPAGVRSLDDLGNEQLLIGLCAESVPCGDLARETLGLAGVTPAIDSNEPDVRALLVKIAEGELDAGITYATDVAAVEGAVEGIEIADDHNAVAEYRIAMLAGAANRESGSAFIEFVLSTAGQEIIAQFGFGSP